MFHPMRDLSFRVVRRNKTDGEYLDELAQCLIFPIAKGAWKAAMLEYPDDLIMLQHGSRVIRRSTDI